MTVAVCHYRLTPKVGLHTGTFHTAVGYVATISVYHNIRQFFAISEAELMVPERTYAVLFMDNSFCDAVQTNHHSNQPLQK